MEEGFEEEVKVDIASSRSQLCAARISVQRSGSSKPVIAWKYANCGYRINRKHGHIQEADQTYNQLV